LAPELRGARPAPTLARRVRPHTLLEHYGSSIAQQACQRQTAAMHIEAATKSDIPAIMRVERVEGYAPLVGRWEAEQHATEIENPSNRYLVARDGSDITGFAILQGVGSAHQCIRLRRIA